jgi:hypothetical protein
VKDGLDTDLGSILGKSVRVKELLPRVERPLEEVAQDALKAPR